MKKGFVLILVLFGVNSFVSSQKVELSNSVVDYIKKSTPQASQFQKYGDLPVNTNTGAVQISVPLFNLGIKNVDWPISLSYHTGGIKVNDVATCAGLGWSLNAGGMISSRTFQRSDVFLSNTADSSAYRKTFTLTPSSNPTWNNPCSYVNLDDIGVVRYINIQKAGEDTRFQINYLPDIFYINAGALNTKFFIKKDTGYCLPSRDISIIHIPGSEPNNNAHPGSWIVTDENGTKYTFEPKGGNATVPEGSYDEGSAGNPSYYSSYNPVFALTQIENVFGEKLNFYYSTECYTYRNNDQDEYRDYVNVQGGQCNNPGDGFFVPSHKEINSEVCDARLDSIASTNGQVVHFKYSSRNDLSGASKLDTAILYSRAAATNFIRSFALSNSYWGTGPNSWDKRLRLDSVREMSYAAAINARYSFTYNSDTLPSRRSPAQDSAGHYNGQTGNTNLVPVHGGNRSFSTQYTKACALEKVNYPTGGSTLLEYERKQYGGLRIKRLKDSLDGATVNLREYEYGTPYFTGGGGMKIFSKDINEYQYVCNDNYTPKDEITCPYNATYSDPMISLSNSYYGDGTERYLTVTEYFGTGGVNGKNEYKYTDPTLIMQPGMIGQEDFLTEKNTYKKNGGGYDLITKEKKKFAVLEGTGSLYTNATSIREKRAWGLDFDIEREEFETSSLDCGEVTSSSTCFPGLYYQISIRLVSSPLMIKSDSTYFYSTDTLLTVTNYTYNVENILAPVNTIANDSKGNIRTEKFKYPIDYNSITATDTISAGIKNLITKHVVNAPVENSVYLQNSDSSNNRLISSVFTSYRKDIPVPYRLYAIAVTTPLTDFTPSTVYSGAVAKDSRYETRILFNSYDSKGNLLEQQKANDQKTSYLWDHSYTYPVAQVENSDSISIAYTSFEADSKGNWSYSGSATTDTLSPTGTKYYNISGGNITKSGLSTGTVYVVTYWRKDGTGTPTVNSGSGISQITKSGWTLYSHEITGATSSTVSGSGYIDELRLYPKGALMTTYTYNPLIGMTSQCDATSHINYYKYDAFGRLKLVQDQDRNIIKVLDYQFKQSQNQ